MRTISFKIEEELLQELDLYLTSSPPWKGEGSVCPYTFISIILFSFMIECRDLALNHTLILITYGSWDSFEPNGMAILLGILMLLVAMQLHTYHYYYYYK